MKQAKLKDAIWLLRNTHLTIEEIATKMKYEDEANFCRAFKNWCGQTPSAIRRIQFM
ncbi:MULTISPECIES: helix-turn-helix domain-containing protein [Acinetobacter calcoaceticus/baumannii complex]|uniref:helix-turn-helix domain-containing protein n=1 Tax=Acinetobacter calcoaceticus/baumannii complex TaxID=909768 RepID=UPI001580A0B1|nr:helix-turn-helix transcriptional regulator [Acinetobacter lactucae]